MMRAAALPGARPAPHGAGFNLGVADWTMILTLTYACLIVAAGFFLELSNAGRALALAIATVGAALALSVAGPRRAGKMTGLPIGMALILFLLMSAASNQVADFVQLRDDSEAMWRQLALAMLPVALFWGARSWAWHRFSLRGLDWGMALLILICAASVLLDYAGILATESYGSRHFGIIGDPVAWIATLPTIYFLLRGRWALLALCLLVMLMTQTRGAFVVTAGAVMLSVLFSPVATRRAYLMRLGAMVLGIGSVFLAQTLMNTLLQRFADLDLFENDRTRTLEFTFDVFLNRPAIGSGFNAHTYYFVPASGGMATGTEQWSTPVSTFAQVLADAGVVGFIPFFAAMAMICFVCFRAIRLRTQAKEIQGVAALAAWVLSFIVLNQSAAWLLPGSLLPPLLFVAAGIVVGAMSRIDNSLKSGVSAGASRTGSRLRPAPLRADLASPR